jgi:hypothetical protein
MSPIPLLSLVPSYPPLLCWSILVFFFCVECLEGETSRIMETRADSNEQAICLHQSVLLNASEWGDGCNQSSTSTVTAWVNTRQVIGSMERRLKSWLHGNSVKGECVKPARAFKMEWTWLTGTVRSKWQYWWCRTAGRVVPSLTAHGTCVWLRGRRRTVKRSYYRIITHRCTILVHLCKWLRTVNWTQL